MKNEFDELEEFVRHHREAFDPMEPDPELWKRIVPETEQPAMIKRGSRYRFIAFRAAAAVAFLFAAGVFWLQHDATPALAEATPEATEKPAAADELEGLIPEFMEAEAFYAQQVTEKLGELKAVNPDMEEEIRFDLKELDSAYNELKEDLREDLANREIVDAMIQNYRLKLMVLENILEQLRKTETKTPDNATDNNLL